MVVENLVADEKKTSLSSAIDDAAKNIKFPGSTEEVVEKKTVETEAKTTEDQSKTKAEETEAALEADKTLTLRGRQLMEGLNNPETAPLIIDYIAKQAGYSKPETKQEAKEVKNEVLEALKEHLGTEFDFLAEKLAPAISKIVDASVKHNTQDVRESLAAQQQERTENEANATVKTLASEFFGADALPKDVEAEMERLIKKYNPAPGDSVQNYLKDIFNLAVQSKGLVKTNKASTTKIDKNRTDAASRLSTSAGATPSGEMVKPNKPMTLDESIRDAMEKAKKKD